jgi:diguanylate cyclase (GGDEF)-like protein/PAS domain S-box-containing protein
MTDTIFGGSTPLILVVDDDRFMRTSFRHTLEQAGFRTTSARNGAEALTRLHDHRPHLALLDLEMPVMDGFALCREIRGIPAYRHLPIVAVTGKDDMGSINLAFESGATDFLAKPVNHELLVNRVRYMLRASDSMYSLSLSEAALSTAQQIARLGNWEWEVDSGRFRCSKEAFRILGFSDPLPDISFDNFLSAIDPADRTAVKAALQNIYRDSSCCTIECRITCPDGATMRARIQGQAAPLQSEASTRVVGTIQDITEMRNVETRLQLLKEAVDCLPLGITISDAKGRIIYANPAEAQIHGYTVEELIEQEARNLAPESLRAPPSALNPDHMGLWMRESVNIDKSGREFPVQLSSLAVRNSEEGFLGIVTVCEDISSRKEAEARIHHLAYHDTLTGLPNRRTFMDRLDQALALAKRGGYCAGLLFLDLDNFKDVNDTRGHAFGDILLKEVAARLGAGMREADSLARIGGDEFVVVLSSITDRESAARAAQRILSMFARPFTVAGQQIFSTVSIGIALCPDDGLDAETMFRCADTAMYQAKDDGKGQFRFFSDDMNRQVNKRVTMENSLREAMERREFTLLYQPQWNLTTGRMDGVEALLRWNSHDYGPVSPTEFITLAEQSGLIVPLGAWVLLTACMQRKEWADRGHDNMKMAVNISARQFRQNDFIDVVRGCISETGIDPAQLELEFTESVVMENAEKTMATLTELKNMRVGMSIDDFGTGYSSLSYLKHFPIDRLKIDGSFVTDFSRNKEDAAIVEAIISLAHSLGLSVVAEGIETVEQLQFLTSRKCDAIQGFYLAPPLTAEALIAMCEGAEPATQGKPAAVRNELWQFIAGFNTGS